MKRRDFLAASLSMGAVSAGSYAGAVPEETQTQIIELLKYRLPVGSRKNLVPEFYRDVAIPAYNRLGIKSVGVFNVKYGPTDPTLYVLIPHKSVDSFLDTPSLLLQDDEYRKAGNDVLDSPLSDPAYVRLETCLLKAFKNIPEVEIPEDLLENTSRIYELRTYESHNRKAAKKKIEMFNEGGEIEVFRKTGLRPVFFGETLAGPLMPNLTYMLVFDSMTSHDKHWDEFRVHPDWLKLRNDPQYRDTVSNVTDIILTPTPFSQI
jgi:hypothetical protein